MGIVDRKEKVKHIRREDIIHAAEVLIFEKGYDRVTMDEIAKQAEYTKRTLYAYFQSKEQLLHAIIYRAYTQLNSMINKELSDNGQLNGLAKLKKLGGVFIQFINLYPKYFEIIAFYNGSKSDLPLEDEFRAASDGEGEQAFRYLTRIIQEGIEDQSIRSDIDVEKTAFVLYGNIIGIANLVLNKESYLLEHQLKAKDFIEEVFVFIERSIANREILG